MPAGVLRNPAAHPGLDVRPVPSDSHQDRSTDEPSLAVIVLAAGAGTRMRSATPKPLHELGGRPLVGYALRAAAALGAATTVVVVGHGADEVKARLGDSYAYALQMPQQGTAHAVEVAMPQIPANVTTVLVLYSDTPLFTVETLATLLATHAAQRATLTILTAHVADPAQYGRIMRDAHGRVTAIVEAKAATAAQLHVDEINSGVCCFDARWLRAMLPHVELNAAGERYLTDLVALALRDATGGSPWPVATAMTTEVEAMGVNDRVQLAQAEAALRARTLHRLMIGGVTIRDPANTAIDDTVSIGCDTIIEPGCVIRGDTVIGTACVIGPHTMIADSRIGDRCRVIASAIERSSMESDVECGPFSHLRPGSVIREGVHIGNFAEIKNATLGPHSAMGHFSYLGDATVGARVNYAAGSVTANYDGTPEKKWTEIGDDAFIGCDTVFVAPVTVGAHAVTGAGAIVTRDVAEHSLVVGVPARPVRAPHDRPSEGRE